MTIRSKPLMVMVHGFPEFWFSWRYQLEYFSKVGRFQNMHVGSDVTDLLQDYWCVALDNRGYGDSDKPNGLDNYMVDKLSTDIKNLVEALGRKDCILVGHDWGGVIGYGVCQLYPKIVKAYIAINGPHRLALFKQYEERNLEQTLKSWYILFFKAPFLPEWFLRLADMPIFDGLIKDCKEDSPQELVEAYKYTFRDRYLKRIKYCQD